MWTLPRTNCAAWLIVAAALKPSPHSAQSHGLRAMKAYYARANEIEGTSTDGTIVAYYCRAFGFSKVVANMGALGPGDKQELMQYMDSLEKNKEEVRELGVSTPSQGAAVVAKFARNVFDHGDTEDRLGCPNASTVRSLVAAGIFMDTLNFFEKDLGDKGSALLQDFNKKAKFAKWRAAEIARAMKAGTAVPLRQDAMGDTDPAPDESMQEQRFTQAPAVEPRNDSALDAMFAALPSVPAISSGTRGSTTAADSATSALVSAPVGAPISSAHESVSKKDQSEAQKHAKYAVSALQFNDVPTAIQELRQALALLGAA